MYIKVKKFSLLDCDKVAKLNFKADVTIIICIILLILLFQYDYIAKVAFDVVTVFGVIMFVTLIIVNA